MYNKHSTYLHHQINPPDSGASTSMVNEILLHDMLSAGHYPVTDPPAPHGSDPLCPRTLKRDRHSKINTSQGPRDRRVRLSIGVARKFFDLQEMLGFDKPSKTLDWLLTKSKSAIKNLVNSKQQQQQQQQPGSAGCSLSQCCDEINNNIESNEINKSLRKKGKSKKAYYKDLNLAKESRVKARARARERTREKMCNKQQMCISEYDRMGTDVPVPIQYMNNQLEVCSISGEIMHYNNNGTENWDNCTNFESQSGLSAILGQHKFNINSSSNN